ncbi:MAG: hypothetical protein IJN90_07375 [Bacilli bacterium]|nr:hypothetical protein [Bacilli bacterium]
MNFIDSIKKKLIVSKLSFDILKNGFGLTKKGKSGTVDLEEINAFNEEGEEVTEVLDESIDKETEEVKTLPNYEPTLSKGIFAGLQGVFYTPVPLLSKKTILDKSMSDLLDMGVDEVRNILMNEINALERVKSKVRNEQLQKIFTALFRFQTLKENSRKFGEDEQRFYAELISTPGFLTNPYVRKFLKEEYFSSNYSEEKKARLLEKISDFYESHSKEEIEKFNYVFMVSDDVASYLLDNDVNLDEVFSRDFLSKFDKEDLSLIYRFHLGNMAFKELIKPENEKVLFLVSAMTKQVKSITGHSAEFIDSVFRFIEDSNFTKLLNSYYDEAIKDKSNHDSFLQVISNTNCLHDFVNYMIRSHYELESSYYYVSPFSGMSSWKDFVDVISNERKANHQMILGDDFLKLFSQQHEGELPKLKLDEKGLIRFKEAILSNLYGITLADGEYFSMAYAQHLSELLKGIPPRNGMSDSEYLASLDESKMTIKKEDFVALQLLQAIDSVVKINIDDPKLEEKVEVLQRAYLKQLKAKGIDYKSPYASFAIVEGILNNMYINTYNKKLTPASKGELIEISDGIRILDAGVEFDMIVTSLNGVGSFFDGKVNMASKWNTASLSSKHGICTSYINAQNIGVINLTAPFLVFSDIPSSSLDAMGTSDIWTGISSFNLRMAHRAGDNNRRFVPGTIMADETRYGYNEILVDRFLSKSEDGNFKLQPDYIMYFKCGSDYRKDPLYKGSLQMAKDFGIPLKIVDVLKVKEHEKSVIDEMREELFRSDVVNSELMQDIVTRYMNNYTGSLVFVGSGKYDEDFSVEGMRTFFNEVYSKISSLEDKKQAREWIDALEKSYLEEERRFREARSTGGYSYSVGSTFILDTYDVSGKIGDLKSNLPKEIILDEIEFSDDIRLAYLTDGSKATIVPDSKLSPGMKTLLDFKKTFEIVDNLFYEPVYDSNSDKISHVIQINEPKSENVEEFILESLVFSYFTGSMAEYPISFVYRGVAKSAGMDIKLNDDENFDLISGYSGSFYEKVKIKPKPEKIDKVVSKIEALDDKSFLQIFRPLIEKKAMMSGNSFEEISSTLLDRKKSIRENFEKFEKLINSPKGDSNEKKDETGKNI